MMILKIIKNCLFASFPIRTPHIYKYLSLIGQSNFSFDLIQAYLTNQYLRPEDAVISIEGGHAINNLRKTFASGLESKILSAISHKDIIAGNISLGSTILNYTLDLESDDYSILRLSLDIIISIMSSRQSYTYPLNSENSSEEYKEIDKYLLKGISYPKSADVRLYFNRAIYILCRSITDTQNALASNHFINLFFHDLLGSTDPFQNIFNEKFELLCRLIQDMVVNPQNPGLSSSIEDESFDLKDIFNKLMLCIEKYERCNVEDKVFRNLLDLREKILKIKSELQGSIGFERENDIADEFLVGFNLPENEEDF